MVKSEDSATFLLSKYITSIKYQDIPPDIIEKAKILIIDMVANIIGGYAVYPGRIIADYFTQLGGSGEATLIPQGGKIPLVNAIFTHAHIGNILDYDDTYKTYAHPGGTVIPPAISCAETLNSSGKELITSVVAGYEVSLRITDAVAPLPPYDNKPWGFACYQIFGTAAAIGYLEKLDIDQMMNAIGIAGFHAPIPTDNKGGMNMEDRPTSWMKNNFGWASMGGTLAVQFSKLGVVGNRSFLDGPTGLWSMIGSNRCDWDLMVDGLGAKYLISEVEMKPYPSCRWAHSTIEACELLFEKNHPQIDQIKKITVLGNENLEIYLAEKEPANVVDAQFSLPFLAALTIMGYNVRLGVQEAHLSDEKLLQLAEKVHLVNDPLHNELYRKYYNMGAKVILELKNNVLIEEDIKHAKGSPQRPVTPEELQAKFLQLCSQPLGEKKAQELYDQLLHLEKVENIAELIAMIVS